MQLTKAEKRVYTVVGLFLAGLLVSAVFDLSHFVLAWLFVLVPLVFALTFGLSLWRGTRRKVVIDYASGDPERST